ncbi:MAG TPA: hypothetical protein VGQ35_16020 [Dongiaceae bacterium]|nr:hypothetical protein [Dongiaceae bacterium]
MTTRIDFRDCVHHGIAGPTAEHILASIRAEYCMPPSAPVATTRGIPAKAVAIQAEDFSGLERALGASAFRQLLSDLRRSPGGRNDLGQLPDFLARHRYGRATAALVDLARLELALSLSERAPAVPSIGACCLPPPLLRAHPDLTLVLHPAWQWLDLDHPADHWRNALLGHDAAGAPPPLPRATRLRLCPEQGRTTAQRLSPAVFAFEHALRDGATLRQAGAAAGAHTASFDAMQCLLPLLMAGAVIDVDLHPAHAAPNPNQPTISQQR